MQTLSTLGLIALFVLILWILSPKSSAKPGGEQISINGLLQEFIEYKMREERYRQNWRLMITVFLTGLLLFSYFQCQQTFGPTPSTSNTHIEKIGTVNPNPVPETHPKPFDMAPPIPEAPLPDIPEQPAPRFDEAERDAILNRHQFRSTGLDNHYIWIEVPGHSDWQGLAERLADFEMVGWQRVAYLDLTQCYTKPGNLSGLYLVLSAAYASREAAEAEREYIVAKSSRSGLKLNNLQMVKIVSRVN